MFAFEKDFEYQSDLEFVDKVFLDIRRYLTYKNVRLALIFPPLLPNKRAIIKQISNFMCLTFFDIGREYVAMCGVMKKEPFEGRNFTWQENYYEEYITANRAILSNYLRCLNYSTVDDKTFDLNNSRCSLNIHAPSFVPLATSTPYRQFVFRPNLPRPSFKTKKRWLQPIENINLLVPSNYESPSTTDLTEDFMSSDLNQPSTSGRLIASTESEETDDTESDPATEMAVGICEDLLAELYKSVTD